MSGIRPCLGCRRVARQPAKAMCAECEASWLREWRCWLPFPPSVNNLFTQGIVRGKVRRFPSRRYKVWREEAIVRIRSSWRTRPPYPLPVVVKLELVPPDGRARDADNYAKPVLDALVGDRKRPRVLVDDSNRWVKAVIPYWQPPGRQSGVIVIIRLARDLGAPAVQPAPTAGPLFDAATTD